MIPQKVGSSSRRSFKPPIRNPKPCVRKFFGPVLTIYVYEDVKYAETLKICSETSPYALTAFIISQDRLALTEAASLLRQSAGNLYLNDKPTGAVVSQQPFGGARRSGTNDKAEVPRTSPAGSACARSRKILYHRNGELSLHG